MDRSSVVLIAFEEKENLGIRFLDAVLTDAGYQTVIIDFRRDQKEILEELLHWDPLIVGFSVVFEKHLYEFRELIHFLRREGLTCHFTVGGYFASLRPGEFYEINPEVDSIVRFEGEHTLLDLVNHLHSGEEWRKVQGIAYKENGQVICNPLRPLEPDLDQLPYHTRSEFKKFALNKKYATLMAGRGCIYNCIYCNIMEFYKQPPGPVKRIRDPVKVAEEIKFLHTHHGCSIFLIEDDDFPVRAHNYPGWIEDFCMALEDLHLSGNIMWKINCRPDEVEQEPFALMRKHGLYRVFLGIEDGTDTG